MKKLLAIICMLIAADIQAAELSAVTRAEITHLFAHLENSGCQFNRNGIWYPASEAVAHLKKKHDYLLKKELLTTTESFIEKAATESSMSNKPYEVKCEGRAVVQSSVWFNAELQSYRKSKH